MIVSETCAKISTSKLEMPVDIAELVREASDCIGPVWPLKNGIACNPFLGWEHKKFWKAIEESESLFSYVNFSKTNEELVNRHFIKWIQAFLDEGQAIWKMPDRHLGFYRSWRQLACYDRLLIKNEQDRKTFDSFSEDPEKTLELGMRRLGIANDDRVNYLRSQLMQLAGWAGYVKWKTDWQSESASCQLDLVEFLAVRIVISCLVANPVRAEVQSEEKPSSKHLWSRNDIEGYEQEYKGKLVGELLHEAKKEPFSFRREKPQGQLIFCIDVRSEPFRKQLEAQGNWETFGFAGFFGLPISLRRKEASEKYASCPVLLKPRHDVRETSSYPVIAQVMYKIRAFLMRSYKVLKDQFGSPFALAEAIGPWAGAWMTIKSLCPKAIYALKDISEKKSTHNFCSIHESIPLKQQIAYAESALSMIGLTKDFAPIVIFCGHGATVQNNPHASTLNCGACGGNAGGPNARLMASILNSSSVRLELHKRGIEIPEETLFLGAEHDTTTDNVKLFYNKTDMANQSHVIERLEKDLKSVQLAKVSVRDSLVGSVTRRREQMRKSVDWSETRPEWGLAKNAAFLVAPRTLSANLDLNGRCFLHSYDWRSDCEGTSLETILTAPMVVAEWINTQYFFSAFHPVRFGSGSKITHNIVGKMGVMQGNASDLMHGLPLQSIYCSDMEPYHIPMRLLTVILAPKSRIDSIVNKHGTLQNLFFNQWVKLVVIDPIDLKAYQLKERGVWDEIPG